MIFALPLEGWKLETLDTLVNFSWLKIYERQFSEGQGWEANIAKKAKNMIVKIGNICINDRP